MRIRESAAEYVVKNGKRTAVILPLEEYQELLEDLYDLTATIARRKIEPTIPLAEIKRKLKKECCDISLSFVAQRKKGLPCGG